MHLDDYQFELPEELIARYPLPERSASRLLVLDRVSGEVSHRKFIDLPELLSAGDLMVFNNTRVIPARLLGHKLTGGKIEVLIERIIDQQRVLAHVKGGKSLKSGTRIIFNNNIIAAVIARKDDLFELQFPNTTVTTVLETIGHMPLPPYLNRTDEIIDKERYQTVFATQQGAVAAPTAGLHFDKKILQRLAEKQIANAEITLHVGAGTFQPVRVEKIAEHKMHAEYLEVDAAVCEKIKNCKQQSKRVVAVGTTSVRALETAAKSGEIQAYHGDTDIFIYPGYAFRCVDAILTNFHLPKSTLLMLIAAFAGRENVLAAYQQAIEHQYRFFSYGDAMLIL